MPLHSTEIRHVDRFELATILAALRLLQATLVLPAEIEGIATDQGDFERLDDEAIDELCERINAGSSSLFRHVADPLTEHSEDDVAEAEREEAAFEMQMGDRATFAEGV